MHSRDETSEYATVRTPIGCCSVKLLTSPDYARNVPIRPDKLDLLFLISHFLDLGAGGRLLFITSLFNLMSRSHEACLT